MRETVMRVDGDKDVVANQRSLFENACEQAEQSAEMSVFQAAAAARAHGTVMGGRVTSLTLLMTQPPRVDHFASLQAIVVSAFHEWLTEQAGYARAGDVVFPEHVSWTGPREVPPTAGLPIPLERPDVTSLTHSFAAALRAEGYRQDASLMGFARRLAWRVDAALSRKTLTLLAGGENAAHPSPGPVVGTITSGHIG